MATIALNNGNRLLLSRCNCYFGKVGINYNFPASSHILQQQTFATLVTPERPRPGPNSGKWPLQKHKLHKQRQIKNDGHLGYGPDIDNPARRWRGGRYNYFDWDTLKTCICNCSSAIERDRMPSPMELNYFYRGASIGVRHHGGFAVVAQLLNLNPMRPWVTRLNHFPTWIEEEQIEKKINEYSHLDRAPSPPHRHKLPPYLRNMLTRVYNIQGRKLSRKDKRRMTYGIYAKINKRFYEEDKQRRLELQSEWETYKQWIRDKKIIEEVEQGFLEDNEYRYEHESVSDESISHLERIKPKESDQKTFKKKYMSARPRHILLEHSTHLAREEEKFITRKPTGFRDRMTSLRDRLPSLRRRKKKAA